jgi:transposase
MLVLGIDISKDTLVCSLLGDRERAFELPNSLGGLRKLTRSLPQSTLVCFESTGPYGKLLIANLTGHFELHQLNDNQIKAAGSMSRTKTDQRDAALIAEAGMRLALFDPKAFQTTRVLWREENENLLLLVGEYERLKDEIVSRQAQLDALGVNPAPAARTIERRIRREIASLQKAQVRAKADIEADIAHRPDAQLIRSIPGLGVLNAAALAAKIADIARFETCDQLKGYVGAYPRRIQSGRHEAPARMARHGCALLRHLLWNAAKVAARHNPVCKALFERLVAKGKHAAAAYGAVMRKLVELVYGVLRSGKPFDPEYNA